MPPRRKLLSAPERSASILAAAARVFAANGYARTSLDDIAAEAGITKLIIYRHFESKAALYLAVLDQVGARLADAGRPSGDVDTPAAAIATVADALARTMAVAREFPEAFTLLLRDAPREPEFADHARGVLGRGVPDAEAALGAIQDPTVRRWTAEIMSAAVDQAMISWLRLSADGDGEMARRLATVLAAIGGAASA